MKNRIVFFATTLLFGSMGINNYVSAQTVPLQETPTTQNAPPKALNPPLKTNKIKIIGKDTQRNTVYQNAKGVNYYLNPQGKKINEPKDEKITPANNSTTLVPK